MSKITEKELVLPSLYLMMINEGTITTEDLRKGLRRIMKPSGDDEEILAKRSDTKFDQKVRNLKAHNTFERGEELATYNPEEGCFELKRGGLDYVQRNQEIIRYLLTNDFDYDDIAVNFRDLISEERKVETFEEDIMVSEGFKRTTYGKVYERSAKLRDHAIQYYQDKNGRIDCSSCGFNFDDFYGPELSKGFIEMHHVKPVFKYEDEDLEQYISEAVKNLAPVCSNCHRMIHRDWNDPLQMDELRKAISENGVFRGKRVA